MSSSNFVLFDYCFQFSILTRLHKSWQRFIMRTVNEVFGDGYPFDISVKIFICQDIHLPKKHLPTKRIYISQNVIGGPHCRYQRLPQIHGYKSKEIAVLFTSGISLIMQSHFNRRQMTKKNIGASLPRNLKTYFLILG